LHGHCLWQFGDDIHELFRLREHVYYVEFHFVVIDLVLIYFLHVIDLVLVDLLYVVDFNLDLDFIDLNLDLVGLDQFVGL